jgi:hypothetical protein
MLDQKDCTILIPHLGSTPEEEYAMDQCTQSLRETVPDMRIIQAVNSGECTRHQMDLFIFEQGQCKAVNAAAATVNTPWIFVTNDDMIYAPGWWEKLTRAPILSDCISPKLIEPRPGAPTFEVQPFGGAGGDFDKEAWLKFAESYTGSGPRKGFNLPFLIKKELFDLIGGYDINYDPWGSNGDSDLEYKIKLAGVQPYQMTESIVYHFSQTSGTFHPDNDVARFNNYAYFKKKWGFDRTDEGIWQATFEIPPAPVRLYEPWWEDFYNKRPLFRGMRVGETYGE